MKTKGCVLLALLCLVTAAVFVFGLAYFDKERMQNSQIKGTGQVERAVTALETIAAEERKQTELMR